MIFPEGETIPVQPMSLEKFITDFIMAVKDSSPDIGHVIVVFDNLHVGNTVGVGSIAGVKDMNRCVEMLENYVETLKAGIPQLH